MTDNTNRPYGEGIDDAWQRADAVIGDWLMTDGENGVPDQVLTASLIHILADIADTLHGIRNELGKNNGI